jgi:hypothetical protein
MSQPIPTDEPHKPSIFYSWQSDLPNSTNRGFIRGCIDRAIRELGQAGGLQVVPRVGEGTQGVPGTPSIAETIFEKIDKCDVFIGDVSIVNGNDHSDADHDPTRFTPNPNVLLELGYAARALSWNQVLCVSNLAYGSLEQLPFDLRGRRIIPYTLREGESKTAVRGQLVAELKSKFSELFTLATARAAPWVEIQFADALTHRLIGDNVGIEGTILTGFDVATLPDYTARYLGIVGGTKVYAPSSGSSLNRSFYRDYAWYLNSLLGAQMVAVAVKNLGDSLLTGVRVVLDYEFSDGVLLMIPAQRMDPSDG